MVTIISDYDQKINQNQLLKQIKLVTQELDIKGNLTIKLGRAEESQKFNAQYRGKDHPTDVLSFYYGEEQPEGFYLGDILICMPVAVEQARDNSIEIEEELFTLMVHGILHLAGQDHETDDGSMLKKQQQLMDKFWPQP